MRLWLGFDPWSRNSKKIQYEVVSGTQGGNVLSLWRSEKGKRREVPSGPKWACVCVWGCGLQKSTEIKCLLSVLSLGGSGRTHKQPKVSTNLPFFSLSLFFFFGLFRAAPAAYRSAQARGQIRAVAAGLPHSHSDPGSELCL